MDVTLIGCICLRGKYNRLRDMLIAEGFTVRGQKIRRPGHLRVVVQGTTVWSWRLFRRMPRQQELSALVRKAIGV